LAVGEDGEVILGGTIAREASLEVQIHGTEWAAVPTPPPPTPAPTPAPTPKPTPFDPCAVPVTTTAASPCGTVAPGPPAVPAATPVGRKYEIDEDTQSDQSTKLRRGSIVAPLSMLGFGSLGAVLALMLVLRFTRRSQVQPQGVRDEGEPLTASEEILE
jgi:hypothetical protein